MAVDSCPLQYASFSYSKFVTTGVCFGRLRVLAVQRVLTPLLPLAGLAGRENEKKILRR